MIASKKSKTKISRINGFLLSFVKISWKSILIVGSILGLVTSILVLPPKINISYATDVIPQNNPLVIPIRVSNESLFPISHIQMFITNNLVCEDSTGKVTISNDKNRAKDIPDNLSAGDFFNFVHKDNEIIGVSILPSNGTIKVELTYQYFFITCSTRKTFSPYKSKDGNIRWLAR